VNIRNVLPRDAIPSIDEPTFSTEYFGESDDDVVVVDGDPPRAYPLRILSYHEIVNDTVGMGNESTGDVAPRPIAVTWCPICWSAVVYERVVDDRTLRFGVSGTLADDALVMYDRETGSEWKQPTGRAIAGPLEGSRLTSIPAPVTSWERFRREYPDGVVLQPVETGGERPAERYDMAPYERYVDGDEFGLYGMRGEGDPRSWDRDDLDPKTVVLGIERNDDAVGYPVPRVEEAGGLVTDTVGDLDLVVVTEEGGIYAFEDPRFDYELREGTVVADGTTWNPVTGEASDGRSLTRVPGRLQFAFAWQDSHGETAFY
jgi:hypothetical protein